MHRFLFSLISLISLFLFLCLPASAAGVWISPYNGDYDTTYTAHANGFLAGEGVDTWVKKPHQWQVGQGEYKANASGAIELEFRPDVTWGFGEFWVIARGLTSNREFIGTFYIGSGGYPLAPCVCRSVFLGSPGGTAVNYNAQGYGSSEIVIVYMTDPSAQIHRLPNAQADPWGNLAFPIYLSQDALYGPYLFTARGLTTGLESYNTLTFWGGIQNHRSSNPISFATPTFELHTGGYTPQETVWLRLTYPNNTTALLATVKAGDDGSIHYSYIVPPGSAFGVYALTGTGTTSGNVASARFKWDGAVTQMVDGG